MDINENNFRNYVSKIQHLIDEEVNKKMVEKLAGFVKTDQEGTRSKAVSTSQPTCATSSYGCCPDLVHPQHGYRAYGCCATSKFGCCPDNMSPAPAPYFDVSASVH